MAITKIKSFKVDPKKYNELKKISKKEGKFFAVVIDEAFTYFLDLKFEGKNANPKNK